MASQSPDKRAQDLIGEGDKLFGDRLTLMSLWQEIAYNTYLERADFTLQRVMGNTLGENLMTSYPLIARRELANTLGTMLRPKETEWFFAETTRMDRIDTAGKKWLERATRTQRRALYDRESLFVKACKEGDHDFAAFGQAALYVSLNKDRDALLFRTFHLRDVAWSEDEETRITRVHRKGKMTAQAMVRKWRDTVSPEVKSIADKEPLTEIEYRHVVVPAEDYEAGRRFRRKWMSIYIAVDGEKVLEETNVRTQGYVIPRWQTVSGSQYAYSPATVCGLPDMRLIQAMTLTLLEAGERFTNPPMIAVQEAIRSDIAVYAGGITWVDSAYDERLGEVLRPLTQDRGGMPIGRDMRNDVKEAIAECFFLNKLQMPAMGGGPQMTAFEVGQRVQEYIRQALPIFEPMEQEYNGGLCDASFDILLHEGAFGPVNEIPRSIMGADIRFRFESPLTEIIDSQKGARLATAKQLLATVVDVDPTAVYVLDWQAAFRDALEGNRTPEAWFHDPKMAAKLAAAHAQAAQQAQQLQDLQAGSSIAKNLGAAAPGLSQLGAAMPTPQQAA